MLWQCLCNERLAWTADSGHAPLATDSSLSAESASSRKSASHPAAVFDGWLKQFAASCLSGNAMWQPVQIPIACLPTPRASATRRFKNRMEALALTTLLFGSPIRAEQPQEVIRWFEPVTFCRFRDTGCLQPVSPCGVDIDFEVDDALAKLKRLGLTLETPTGRYIAIRLSDALIQLDKAWDSFFEFPKGDSKVAAAA